MQFGLGQRLAIHIPLHRPQQPQRGSAGLRSGFRQARPAVTARTVPSRAGASCEAGESTARSQADQPTYHQGGGRVDSRTELARPVSPPPLPESRRRPTFAGPDPTVTTEEPLRRRQLLSALVLCPPCSRKWPILGGQGVKSLRRVRSVSTISRFWRLFAFAALHVHTTAVPPPPACWPASHNVRMATWGCGSRGGRAAVHFTNANSRVPSPQAHVLRIERHCR